MDAQRNLHGRSTELALAHNGICMDAWRNMHRRTQQICMDKQRNLLGHITFSLWGKKLIYIFLLFLLVCWDLNLMDLNHVQQQHPSVLLSAHFKKFSVSHMQDFYSCFYCCHVVRNWLGLWWNEHHLLAIKYHDRLNSFMNMNMMCVGTFQRNFEYL